MSKQEIQFATSLSTRATREIAHHKHKTGGFA